LKLVCGRSATTKSISVEPEASEFCVVVEVQERTISCWFDALLQYPSFRSNGTGRTIISVAFNIGRTINIEDIDMSVIALEIEGIGRPVCSAVFLLEPGIVRFGRVVFRFALQLSSGHPERQCKRGGGRRIL